MKHLVIIDGLSFLFRAFYGVRALTRSDGLHTNALYGFCQMMVKVMKDLEPDYCAVALDSIGPTFRKELYPDYKAHRAEMDDDMKEQMPFFEPMIEAFNIPGIRVEGVEADDVIATLVNTYKDDMRITIVSSDKDLMQLLGGNVCMLDTMKGKTFGPDEVVEKFGVGPDKVIEVQALIGDSSDNVPGVKSVGPKTAATLIQEYGDLDALYTQLDSIPREKLKQALVEHKENAFISKELVTLKQDVALTYSKDSLLFEPNMPAAADFMEEMEFKTLAKRLKNTVLGGTATEEIGKNTEKPQQNQGKEAAYEAVTNEVRLHKWLERIHDKKVFAVDTETTSKHAMEAELVGISLSLEEGAACYIPLAHKGGDMLTPAPEQMAKEKVLALLKPILENPAYTKIGQNLKYDYEILMGEGIQMVGMEDTMLMSFCLDGGKHNHGMDDLAKRHLDYECMSFKEVCGTGKSQITFDYAPLEVATRYAAEDADITLRLYNVLAARLAADENAGVRHVYENIERPLIPVIAAMEMRGVQVDRTQLEGLSQEFERRLKGHEARIYEMAGEEFNINSPKQLGEILFDKLGLSGKGKSRSTNVSVLEKLASEGHDICTEVLAYRSLAKLMSTYTQALIGQINARTGRVHTSYNQTGAATGRFSSSDPNLQNIPIRTEDGRKIRRAFVAKPGCQLLSVDYSQIELRLMAHMAASKGLQEAFNADKDIHAYTAHKVFDVAEEDVSDDQRRIAKAINFGLIYGMGSTSLAKQIGASRKEAEEYIENYFHRYEGVRDFMEKCKEQVRGDGYVETLYGRRVHFPGIFSSQPMVKAGAERAAINAPLQGTNADIIKLAMPKIEKRIHDEGFDGCMLMQVHDELIFEVPEAEMDAFAEMVREVMENIAALSVPLKVGMGTGKNWEDAH